MKGKGSKEPEDKVPEKIIRANEMEEVLEEKGVEKAEVVTSATVKSQNASIEDTLNHIKWILTKSNKPLSSEEICHMISCDEKNYTVLQVNKLIRSLMTFTSLKREVIEGVTYFSFLKKD